MSDLTLGVALTSDGNYGKTYTTGYWISAHYFVPTTCEYPDRVLDLVEFLASQEGQDLLHNTTNYVYREDQDAEFWNACTKPYGYGDGRCKYVWFSYLFSGTEYQVDFTNNDWWTAVSHPIDHSNSWATEQDAALVDYARGVIAGYVDEVERALNTRFTSIPIPPEAIEEAMKHVH